MATVNLGAIKFNWKGAYAGSTAYAVDDVVSSGGSSYVCILASTGNAVSNGTYWNIMSSAGTNGTNGTDVGTVITTQGDILYRDGSGLQRLAKGTAGQVLQMNSGATAPEYGTVSSDMVLLHTTAVMSGSIIAVDNIFNSTYDTYKVVISGWKPSADATPEFRFRSGGASGSPENDASYSYSNWRVEQQISGGTATGSDLTVNAIGNTLTAWHQSMESGNGNKVGNTEITIFNANRANSTYWRTSSIGFDSSGAWIANMTGGGVYYKAQVITGIQFQSSTGTTTEGVLKIYGLK
jgi:hypothetical protein